MDRCEKVFSIPKMRLIILSYYIDKYPSEERKTNCCKKSFKNKLYNLKERFFVCILTRYGIVTPTIFR